ncbi:MAG: electron transport complex subunit E, partial [Clostridia bacterium]|nr:electron transport complex subunit E [Clostridia bacterium]
ILGRAEMFAGKNTVGKSVLDGIGMGIGFVFALLCMSTIREILGAGTFAGMPVPFFSTHPISVMTKAPGGMIVYGVMIAIINKATKGKVIKKKDFSCKGCPAAGSCAKGTCETAVKEGK